MSITSILRHLGITEPPGSGQSTSSSGEETETIRRIARSLEKMEPARAKKIAGFAFILSRAANADLSISDEETREMERQVIQWMGLPEEQAVLVVQIAKSQSVLFGGTDNFVVTRDFGQTASREEKIQLLHCLFAVTGSDDSISVVEENTIDQIGSELGFTRREMVDVRSVYRDKRAVMKNLPR